MSVMSITGLAPAVAGVICEPPLNAQKPARRQFAVVPATREHAPLLIGLTGPSGSGKTYSALRLATGLARTVAGTTAHAGRIVFIDTENRRSRHYAGEFSFEHLDFGAPYGSQDYLDALEAAADRRPAVIIIDSLSHEHDGPGGMLDAVGIELDRLAGSDPLQQQKMAAAAWRRPKTLRRALLSRLLTLGSHVIVCMRAQEKNRIPREASGLEPVEMGYMPVAAPEIMFELGLCALLKPGAQGVPTWSSHLPGEHAAIKLPRQFERIFGEAQPLTEAHGEALGRWATGADSSSVPQPKPRRRRILIPEPAIAVAQSSRTGAAVAGGGNA